MLPGQRKIPTDDFRTARPNWRMQFALLQAAGISNDIRDRSIRKS